MRVFLCLLVLAGCASGPSVTAAPAPARGDTTRSLADWVERARAAESPDDFAALETALEEALDAEQTPRRQTLALLAYVQTHAGAEERAVKTYRHLLCPRRFPNRASPVSGEDYAGCDADGADAAFWMALGDLHFERPEDTRWAITAFEHATVGEQAVLARYKIGWALCRVDRMADAVRAWVALLESGAGPLREECLQYLGIAFAEVDWDADGEPDGTVFQRLSSPDLLPPDAPFREDVIVATVRVMEEAAQDEDAAALRAHFGLSAD